MIFAFSLSLLGCGGGGGATDGTTAFTSTSTADNTQTNPSPSSYNISGKIVFNGSGLAGVNVSIVGTSYSSLTDVDGNYTLFNIQRGNYTITPSITGYTFPSGSQTVTVVNGNVVVPVFTATAVAVVSYYTISGKINLNGVGLAGVTVAMTGAATKSVVTDSSGNYIFTGIQNGNYTLTPSLTVYTFAPANFSVSVKDTNATGKDFTATPNTGSIIIDLG